MRLTLSILAVLLLSAIFVPAVRAQASMPYRRTIPYISNRPYQPSGRYVRISLSMGAPQISTFGRSIRSNNSFTIQALINVPVGGDRVESDSSTSNAGDERRRGNGGR